jgi:outer membrane protein W
MNATKRSISYALIVTAVVSLGAASARSEPARVGVGGHYTLSHNNEFDETSSMVGGQLRIRGPFFGAEGAVDYRSEDLLPGVDLKTWPVTASALLYPLPYVYGLAGVGWYHATIAFDNDTLNDAIEDQTTSEIGYHLGAGAELPISTGVALTTDVRWVFIDYDFDQVDEVQDLGNAESDYMKFRAGVLFYFR